MSKFILISWCVKINNNFFICQNSYQVSEMSKFIYQFSFVKIYVLCTMKEFLFRMKCCCFIFKLTKQKISRSKLSNRRKYQFLKIFSDIQLATTSEFFLSEKRPKILNKIYFLIFNNKFIFHQFKIIPILILIFKTSFIVSVSALPQMVRTAVFCDACMMVLMYS